MVTCEYFLNCKNEATCLIPHSTLKLVPSCNRCAKKVGFDPAELAHILEVKDGEFIVDKDPFSTV